MTPLSLHPQTERCPGLSLAARTDVTSRGTLAVHFVLTGDIVQVEVPPRGSQRCEDGLWQHTCFEVFVRAPGETAYYELNFAPSRAWAAYRFRDYRADRETLQDLDPDIEVQRQDRCLELEAFVALGRLSGVLVRQTLLVGLAAVIEASDGTHTYWALRHPPGRPDFHHPDAFVRTIFLDRVEGRAAHGLR